MSWFVLQYGGAGGPSKEEKSLTGDLTASRPPIRKGKACFQRLGPSELAFYRHEAARLGAERAERHVEDLLQDLEKLRELFERLP